MSTGKEDFGGGQTNVNKRVIVRGGATPHKQPQWSLPEIAMLERVDDEGRGREGVKQVGSD